MSFKQGIVVTIIILLSVFFSDTYTDKHLYDEENIYYDYQTEVIRDLYIDSQRSLTIERAYKYEGDERVKWHSFVDYFSWFRGFLGDNYWRTAPIQRIQFRDSTGNVVAYTPTRYSFVLSCADKNKCFVFMWKTIYPLPAIFKLSLDTQLHSKEAMPPMQYSPSQGGRNSMVELTNPFLGLIGLMIFYVENVPFFCFLIGLSIVLGVQITKFHEMTDDQKEKYNRIFLVLTLLNPSFMVIEAYMLTAMAVVLSAMLGVINWGVPFTISALTIVISLLISVIKFTQLKKQLK